MTLTPATRKRTSTPDPARVPAARVRETAASYAAVRPPLTLVLGPAGAGKTEWVLERFSGSHGRALLVVSSPQQADTRAAQIAARAGMSSADVRGAIHTFHSLIAALGKATDADGYRIIGRTFQRLALAEIFQSTIGPGDFLGRMRLAPGFVPALAERLREWKLACLTPDDLENGAVAAAADLEDPAFLSKTRELARLFRAYERFLQQNRLRDEEDCLRQAAVFLADETAPLPGAPSLVLVDGFYRFNRAQRELLAAFASRGLPTGKPDIAVAVTLPYDADRPLLFAAPERTRAALQARFDTCEEHLPFRTGERPAVLTTLAARLFGPTGPSREEGKGKREKEEGDLKLSQQRQMDVNSPDLKGPSPGLASSSSFPFSLFPLPGPQGQSLLLFDAPNPYVEAEMVAREFRRLYDGGGYTWSDFAVILRGMGDYAPILAAVFERYAIPLGVDGPEKLTENPLLKTLLHLLAVVRWGWQRDDVLAFLKSSYTAPGKLEADALRRRARRAGIREGRDAWLALVQDDPAEPGSVAVTLREMAHYDTLLTAERAEPMDFADRIGEILTVFGLEERIHRGETLRAQRDRAALAEARDVLGALAQMARLAGRATLTFAQFHDELLGAWESAASIAESDGDRVRVAEPYDARERPLKVAAVMGLTERVFPRRITEDPFLRDEERAALRQVAGLDLEEQKGRADDERFFFYLAVTAPSEKLLLSFPRSADEADTLPSFYLDEVRAVFAHNDGKGEAEAEEAPRPLVTVSRTLADVAPRPEEAVSAEDRLLAACADLFDPGAEMEDEARSRHMRQAAVQIQASLADPQQAAPVRAVLASRHLPGLPRLEAAALRADFAGHDRVFRIAELEAYGRCPFQYLLRYVLRLRPEEEGTSPRVQETLLHTVLRRYFRRRARSADGAPDTSGERIEAGVASGEAGSVMGTPDVVGSPGAAPPEPADLAGMRAELRVLLAETLERQRLDATPHRLRMAQRLLADALDGFAERETRFGPQFGLTPAHFDLAFGMGADSAAAGEEEPGEGTPNALPDAASHPAPLLLSAPDGGPPVKVCGIIDRVDVDVTGQRALALDYRLDRPPDYGEIQRGASLQMPLYLLALERLFAKVGAVGCYDSARERGRRRFHRTEHVNLRQFAPLMPLDDAPTVRPLNRVQFAELTQTAETTAIQIARAIAAGGVVATPGDHCRACPYGDICRMTVAGGHDGELLSRSPLRPSASGTSLPNTHKE